MPRAKIVLDGEFTDLNTYIETERKNKYAAANLKDYETERVAWLVNNMPPVEKYPVDLTLFWYCKNRRKDPDNIAFAIKFLLDGLQSGGVLKNDGWKQINSICHIFRVDPQKPRVEIFIDSLGD